MAGIQTGDVVARKSYGYDIVFRVKAIYENQAGKLIAILKGVDVRLIADAPLDDLEPVVEMDYNRYRNEHQEQDYGKVKSVLEQRRLMRNKGSWRGTALAVPEGEEYFDIPGKVLHMDGDEEYLNKCLDAYRKLRIPHHGVSVPEKEQPNVMLYYLQKYQPDILVITGHDGLLKDARDFKNMESYRNSRYFVEAVKAARRFIPSRDDLVIFSGACQSYYEELLAAGANFASSPKRVFIHIFDPVFIVEKIAFTSIKETLTLNDVLRNTVTGIDGVGGIETRGCFRLGYPKSPY
ncbi:sporulation peptidase YabG [Candidatus Formimonas warabiya]|uniref:Sporulation peptidase YabG n=1 Tax=Formimonas warabiya TaxID=1761012 RepID=A0A3G1KVI0_FORW1|nr:sporulation peptidase YabG [Candidatus Formimonas warabiya]ATW26488.1 sporulation peptidase YabG [Candidatus Formimonas warabiya]